jgi:hypothetical protein
VSLCKYDVHNTYIIHLHQQQQQVQRQLLLHLVCVCGVSFLDEIIRLLWLWHSWMLMHISRGLLDSIQHRRVRGDVRVRFYLHRRGRCSTAGGKINRILNTFYISGDLLCCLLFCGGYGGVFYSHSYLMSSLLVILL